MLFGFVFVGGAEFGGVFSGEAGAERKLGDHQDFGASSLRRDRRALRPRWGRESLWRRWRFSAWKPCSPALLPKCGERRRRKNAGENFDVGFFERGDMRGINPRRKFSKRTGSTTSLKPFAASAGGKPNLASEIGDALGIKLGQSAPTTLLVGTEPHMAVKTAMRSSSPQKKVNRSSRILFRGCFTAFPKNQDCQGASVVIQGTLFFSHWSLTGLTVAPVLEATIRSTWSDLIRSEAISGRVFLIGLGIFFDDFDGIGRAVD